MFQKHGQMLVELLMAIGITTILLPALLTGLVASRSGKAQQNQRIQAISFMKEGVEAVRSVRDNDWTSFAVNGTYHPAISGSAWTLAAGSETINGMTRQIVITDVSRDSNGLIVSSGGTVDPSTKQIVVTVSWTAPTSANVSSTLYLTRHENATYTETTKAQFDLGTKSSVVTTNTTGGEVTLGAGGGGGDWCTPSLSITSVNLSRQGVPTQVAAVPGIVYTGTGGNASGPTFAKTTVTGNTPPQASVIGIYDNAKANGIYGDSNNFAYVATTSNSQEIAILDTTQFTDPPTNSKFKLIGWFDAPGNSPANAVYTLGNYGYMTTGNKFYIFDLSSKTGSRSQLNPTAVTLSGTGNRIVVVGNYAYVAVNNSTNQLQVINVSDPANPSIVAQATVNSQPGVGLAVNTTGTRAYLVTSQSTGTNFFIINTSSHAGNLPVVSSFSTGITPKSIAIATGNKAIIVGTGGTQQYQVIDIANESAMSRCAGLAVNNGAYDVATVLQSDGYAYAYTVTGDTNAELKIILGGGGNIYTTSGTFESATFSRSTRTAFNSLSATVSQPTQTSIKLQVAVAPAISGSCTGVTYSYLGPGGSPTAYYTVGSDPTTIIGSIPSITSGNYANPGQCFRYKAFLQTVDNTAAPTLYDVTINYSP